jgi:hypothetical protein
VKRIVLLCAQICLPLPAFAQAPAAAAPPPQPPRQEGSDWRVLQVAAVTARLTTMFSLRVSNTIRYAHAPVPGFKDTDTNTSVALVAQF